MAGVRCSARLETRCGGTLDQDRPFSASSPSFAADRSTLESDDDNDDNDSTINDDDDDGTASDDSTTSDSRATSDYYITSNDRANRVRIVLDIARAISVNPPRV